MLENYINRINEIGIQFQKVAGGLGSSGWIIQLKEHNAVVISKDLTHNMIMKILDAVAAHHKKAYEDTLALRKELELEYYQKALHNANNQVEAQNRKGYNLHE